MPYDPNRAHREYLERKFRFRNSWEMLLIMLVLVLLLVGLLAVLDWYGVGQLQQ